LKLPNESGETNITLGHLDSSEKGRNYMFYLCIFPKEVKQAIKKMKKGKAVG